MDSGNFPADTNLRPKQRWLVGKSTRFCHWYLRISHHQSLGGIRQQISQDELAKAQQKHADIDMEGEVELRNRLDDLNRELGEVRVSRGKKNVKREHFVCVLSSIHSWFCNSIRLLDRLLSTFWKTKKEKMRSSRLFMSSRTKRCIFLLFWNCSSKTKSSNKLL